MRRHHQDKPSSRLEETEDVPHGGVIIVDMLEHVERDDGIKSAAPKVQEACGASIGYPGTDVGMSTEACLELMGDLVRDLDPNILLTIDQVPCEVSKPASDFQDTLPHRWTNLVIQPGINSVNEQTALTNLLERLFIRLNVNPGRSYSPGDQ
jgi:hypothetical protein